MRSVFNTPTSLSYVETEQGAFFCHCNTLFIGTKCPDCQEVFSGDDLVATRELAFKTWKGSPEPEQITAQEPEVADAPTPAKATKKSKRTKSDTASPESDVAVDVDDIKPTEEQ